MPDKEPLNLPGQDMSDPGPVLHPGRSKPALKKPNLDTIAPKHGGSNVIPISYDRYSGDVLLQYTDGPQAGTQKTVSWKALTHQGGELQIVRILRRIRS